MQIHMYDVIKAHQILKYIKIRWALPKFVPGKSVHVKRMISVMIEMSGTYGAECYNCCVSSPSDQLELQGCTYCRIGSTARCCARDWNIHARTSWAVIGSTAIHYVQWAIGNHPHGWAIGLNL